MQHQRQWRENYLTSTAVVTHAGGSLSVPATKIDPAQTIAGEGVQYKTDHCLFQFNSADVSAVTWKAGVKINYQSQDYEVVISRKAEVYYDDPTNKTLNVPAKKCS